MAEPIIAGGVVLLKNKGRSVHVGLVHRPRHNDWSLPKGKRSIGEANPVTARREAWEETGEDVTLSVPLSQQNYKVEGRPKVVHYWRASVRSGGPGFRPNREIDDFQWCTPKKAKKILDYARDRDLIDEALDLPGTSPLIIVRHTQAMKRSQYRGSNDQKRPLSKTGTRQALGLVTVLDAFGVRTIYSSSSARCMDTVKPYARRIGKQIAAEPLFTEELFEQKPKQALNRLEELSRQARPIIICTHRPVLPGMLAKLENIFGLAAMDPALSPGAMVILHRQLTKRGKVGSKVIAVERLLDR